MLIEFVTITGKKRYAVELWDEPSAEWEFKEPFGEEFYVNVNDWCTESFGYPARTAYNRFEFKKEKDLTLFILKWG